MTALRSGAVGGHAFAKVIMVGHSLGSFETWAEDAAYHDVNAVIITGALHQLSPVAAQQAAVDLYPAVDDPKFADSGLDPGYLTTVPGTPRVAVLRPCHRQPSGRGHRRGDEEHAHHP